MASFIKGGSFLLLPVAATDIFIPEELSFEQKELGSTTARFSTREVFSKAERIEVKEPGLVPQLLKAAGEQGLLMVEVPETYGGLGLGKVASTVIAENITHDTSFSVAFMCHTGIGTLPVLYYGNEDQKKRYLPKLASGEMLAAYALTEANAGTDALAGKTKATLSPDKKHYILNGEKIFITNGGIADLITVFAKVDGEHFTAFLVEKGFEGVSHGKEEEKMGLHGTSTVSITLTDAKIPVENVLGEIGKGHKIAFNVLNIGRWKLGAACVGAMKRVIGHMAPYANQRFQFGKPIASFELIRQKIARSAILTYLAESLVYRYAGALDKALEASQSKVDAIEEFAIEASIAKVFGSEALWWISDEAVQTFGGYGFIRDYPVEHHLRDCRINRIFEGTNEINRLIITGTLIKRTMSGKIDMMTRLQEILAQLRTGFPEADLSQPLGIWVDQVERLKRLAIYVAGVAVQKYTTALEAHQATLALISDLIIDVYALESGLIRAMKTKSTVHEAAAAAAIAERAPVLASRAKQALVNIAEGGEQAAGPYLKAFDRIVKFASADTDALLETVAARVLEKEAYGD